MLSNPVYPRMLLFRLYVNRVKSVKWRLVRQIGVKGEPFRPGGMREAQIGREERNIAFPPV